MKENRDNIKNIFSSGLKDLEVDLPLNFWDSIEKDISVPKHKRIFTKRNLLKVASIAASIVVVAAATFTIYKYDIFDIAEKNKKNRSIGSINFIIEEKDTPEVITEKIKYRPTQKVVAKKAVVEEIVPIVTEKVEESEVYTVKRSFYKSSTKKLAKNEIPEANRKLKKNFYTNNVEYVFVDTPESTKNKSTLPFTRDSKFILGIDVQGIFPINTSSNWVSSLKTEYKQPLSIGITIERKFTPKLSLQSGLYYSNTQSTTYVSLNNALSKYAEQKFHYIGIPLGINYQLAEWKKFKLSANVGAMFRKDISGKLKTFDLNRNEDSNTSIDQNNSQFSTFADFGFSYPIYEKLYIYTTFGGSYYFDAGNTYRTIYDEKEVQFDLNIGLKFNF